ncbi:auxin response factor 17-like [Iris pallida]|uniref:Auxin response factor n=1 Tax=Iris pallida TaxID=29817 RepID=A0AAX6E2V5_IRIPA|nr:auxin response factor 17-like [Iris pallida]
MSPPSADRRSLDPHIWRACAGTSGKIPAFGSLVYYFPHGHCEQSSAPLSPSFAIARSYSLCRVAAVSLLANPDSDEVFARIRLHPLVAPDSTLPSREEEEVIDADDFGGGDENVVSFAKILTPSDANNGGGFSVPRFCADSIFPELDFKADPPVQTLTVRDVHGNSWDFRHIYRGTPRRHLLTTGWSRFVSSKKLIAGDSVVFIKDKSRRDELSVGIRRTGRPCGGGVEFTKLEEGVEGKDGFSRNAKGRVPARSIVEAVRLMEGGRPFEVMYYPRVGLAEFVVEKGAVERAMAVSWAAGMRVKMSLETEDLSRTTWFQGTVSSVAGAKDLGAAQLRSPWRMLQINWDEPEVLQNVRTVGPWQVELVSASPLLQSPFPDMKKLRVSHCLDMSSEGQGNTCYTKSIFESAKMGSLAPSLFNYNTFPVGIQGARHDEVSSLSNFIPTPTNTHHFFSEHPYGMNMPPELNVSHSEGNSSPSQVTVHQNSLDLFGPSACNPTIKASKGYFQLFGQIIHMNRPSDDDENDSVGSEGEVLSLDFSLSYPHKKLLRGLDIQTQRISAVGACSL